LVGAAAFTRATRRAGQGYHGLVVMGRAPSPGYSHLLEVSRGRGGSMKGIWWMTLSSLGAVLVAGPVLACMINPAPAPAVKRAPAAPSAEEEYGRGLRARSARDWTSAAGAFRRAVELRPGYAEAWNGLGYA